MSKPTRLLAVLLVVGLGAFPAEAQKAKVDIPVTRVVLFSSGVGYFEHTGAVEGDATAQIMFKTDQINDVLKSMVLEDLSGKGTITGVNYASRDPLMRALKSFAIDLSGDPKMADLLKQVRGAEVELLLAEQIKGKIVSVESQTKQITEGPTPVVITETILNVLTEGGIRSFNMREVKSLRLTDETLAAEMNKALDVLIGSHDTQRKAVEISLVGQGRRQVRIGYIAETPIWKTSYRLDLSGEKPFIQGWAIVENTSDSDWAKVNLSLVSGRPISFIQDLYTPLYLPRPVVQPELYASLRPQEYDEGISPEEKRRELAGPGNAAAADGLRQRQAGRAMAAPAPMAAAKATEQLARGMYEDRAAAGELSLQGQGVASIASAGKVGELFNFTIKGPVDLPRRRSAMLPIVNTNIQAEKVSIYNAAVLATHPLNGAYLTNSTGMKLMGGPVTVLDDGMYAGDARIDNLAEKDQRFLSYAIDLNVTVDPSQKSSSQIVAAKIVNGVLQLSRKHSFEQTYTIKNKADKKRDLIVEHPIVSSQRKLLAPEKPFEKTPALYRFRLAVDKESTTPLVVKEEQVDREIIAILNQPAEGLLWYTQNSEISPKVRDAIAGAIKIKQDLAVLEARLGQFAAQRAKLESDQKRQRDNIVTLGKDAAVAQPYVKKLADLEAQIDQLDKDQDELQKQINAKKKDLADYLNKLNVE